MRKATTKIAMFLLIGAIINIVVALAFDWYANTTTQAMSLVRPDDATTHGWIGPLLNDTIAAWGCERNGVSYVASLRVDADTSFEFDITNNLIVFPYIKNNAAVRDSALVLESRLGWPMRAFVGRSETDRLPRLSAIVVGTKQRVQVAMSLHITDRPLILYRSFTTTEDELDVPIRGERLDLSGFVTSSKSNGSPDDSGDEPAVSARSQHHDVRETTEPLRAASQAVVRKVSAEEAASEDIELSGHTGVGLTEMKPLPAAANGRWNARSIVQNFDRNHRVWPLPYRPICLALQSIRCCTRAWSGSCC